MKSHLLTQRVLYLLVVAACGLVLVAGCGGGNSTTDSSPVTTQGSDQPLTKSALIEQADVICTVHKEKQSGKKEEAEALGAAIEKGSGPAYGELANLLESAADTAEREAEDLHELEAPAGDEAAFGSLLGSLDQQVRLTRQAAGAIRAKNLPSFSSLGSEVNKAGEKAKAIAQGYGFKVCGGENEEG